MALKFTGVRGLGNMTPEERSNLLKMTRAIRGASQIQRTIPLNSERSVGYGFGVSQVQGGASTGGRSTVTTFGKDADKPTSVFLLQRGVGAFTYIATDTNKVYMWNGTAYKSAVFT